MTTEAPNFRATYRLQLRKSFPFKAATAVVGYLNELGISHLYLSPILEAAKESNHGYDAIDPTKISEERGGEKGFIQLMEKLGKQSHMKSAILDIVPNHVAASIHNPAWWDVLKFGAESKFHSFFDFRPRVNGDKRIVLPVLGKTLRSVLTAKELKLAKRKHASGDEFVFEYFDKAYPLNPKTVTDDIKHLAPKEIAALSIKSLEALLKQQAYVLEDWKEGSREVNYRRFFDINDLAAIRIDDSEVFDWDHSKIKEMLEKFPLIEGLRVDHVDGLTEPEAYLKKLKTLTPNVWVEKILGDGETMPASWPVNGTTGYEFSNSSSRVFVDLPGLQLLHAHYTRNVDRRWERFHECVYDSKREILETHFVSELTYIVDECYRLSATDRKQAEFTKDELLLAFTELTSSLRVYRTYAKQGEPIQSRWLNTALAEAEGRGRLTSMAAFDWLHKTLLGPGDWNDELYPIIKRWEQLSGPVMAKGLEDTALYRYFPHLSLNGVGGEPDWSGDGAIEFHATNREKLRSSPLAMNTTSTHDTKRSEDVRSRLHVVSELAEEWTHLYTQVLKDDHTVDAPTQYLALETIIGAWPMDGKMTDEFVDRLKQYFLKAVREAKSATNWNDPDQKYEAAVTALAETFVKPKTPIGKRDFEAIKAFAEKCAYFGAFNSLSLITLKALAPGIPDFYQGCEMWDLSLVDPDNRRPVDYELRQDTLKTIKDGRKNSKLLAKRSLSKWAGGEIKLWLTYELLQLRLKMPDVFIKGEYLPLDPIGEGRRHFLGFLRHLGDQWVMVVVPRFLASEIGRGAKPMHRGTAKSAAASKSGLKSKSKVVAKEEWMKKPLALDNEKILSVQFDMPAQAAVSWRNAITGTEHECAHFTARELLEGLPVAIWYGTRSN